MPAKLARFDDDLVSWYDDAAKQENVRRAKNGLKPLSWIDLLRVVAARFAGLPVAHEIDLDGVKRRAKRAAKQAPANMTTPPHGGRKAAAKKAPAKQAKSTSKKAPAKQATTTADMWTRPHGG